MTAETKIVVVGAGVSGLTTALELSKNPSYRISVVAKHQPGDIDIEYASPWAGANYIPTSLAGSTEEKYERLTWPYLEELATDSPQAGIHLLDCHEYFPPEPTEDAIDGLGADSTSAFRKWRSELEKPDPWFSKVVPNFRPLSAAECPKGFARGVAFTSVCINPQIYLPFLQSECIRAGVTFQRCEIADILAAGRLFRGKQSETLARHGAAQVVQDNAARESADVIINCTGLSSLSLAGVEDKAMYPVQGQTILIQEELDLIVSCSDDPGGDQSTPDGLFYAMSRASGGGTILGGSYKVGEWGAEADAALTERILRKAARITPALVPGYQAGKQNPDDWKKLTLVRENVGLRPARKGGVRIEKERVNGDDWQGWIVHNYGHGGYGYQASFGCSLEVVKLVEQCKQES